MDGRMSISSLTDAGGPGDAGRRARSAAVRTRIVAALRLLLPLTALGLLSMVFLLASPIDPTRAIQSAPIDVQDRARDPRLSAARFAGVTEDGTALRIEAGAARSDPGGVLRFQVQDFALWLTPTLGEGMTARSDSGQIDRGAGLFVMDGGVRLVSAPGYDLAASRIDGMLDRTQVRVAGPVLGRAPAGDIQAGSALIQSSDPETGSYRLVFRDGVRLIYQPPD
jgi:lipopolysaccharide export system protein LptC